MAMIKLKAFTQVGFISSVLFLSPGVSGNDLSTVLQQAIGNDPQWASKVHAYKANKQLVKKTNAAIRPSIIVSAQAYEEETESDVFGEDDYDKEVISATLVQPVFRLSNWYTYRKGKQLDKQVEADFKSEEQDFYMRVVEIYLEVLRAEENLRFRLAEKVAIEKQLEQTVERFNAGLAAETDMQEAKAAYDISSVQHIIAEQDLDLALESLVTITGNEYRKIAPLKAEIPVNPPSPDDIKSWNDMALANNYDLKAADHARWAAKKEHRSKRAAHLPTLDLIGSYQDTDRYLQTSLGEMETSSVSLKLELPIYKGGEIGADRRQAKEQYLQSEDDYNYTKRLIIQNTSNFFRVVKTDVSRVNAQKQSIMSAESALSATEAGYNSGTRTLADVLDAQQTLYGAKRDYGNARFDYIFNLLKLKQLAGSLKKEDVEEINTWLVQEDIAEIEEDLEEADESEEFVEIEEIIESDVPDGTEGTLDSEEVSDSSEFIDTEEGSDLGELSDTEEASDSDDIGNTDEPGDSSETIEQLDQ